MPFRATADGFISESGSTLRRFHWAAVAFGAVMVAYGALDPDWLTPTTGVTLVLLAVGGLSRRVRADREVLEVRQWGPWSRSVSWGQMDEIDVDYTRSRLVGLLDGETRIVGGPLPADRQDRRAMHAFLRDRVGTLNVHPPSVDT